MARLLSLFSTVLILAVTGWGAAALAESKPGFAAAYAPESAFETCRADSAAAAVTCAMAACAKSSGYPDDCYVLAACDAGGWAGVMGVMVTEVHFTTVTCGSPSREALIAELKARCAGHLPYMQECWVSQLIPLNDEEPEPVEISWTAQSVLED